MSLLEKLSDPAVWEAFYAYRTSLACPKADTEELRRFIAERAFLPVTELIRTGGRFPLPRRAVISKMHSRKKRVVYIYPPAENTVMKLLTWLLLRKYDDLFTDGLYSFRPGRSAKDAIRRLTRMKNAGSAWAYKVDIHNYFNSVPIGQFLPKLENVLADDPELFRFLRRLLEEPEVLENGQPVTDEKGIMAGTPVASFYANLYLRELDEAFAQDGIPYARYSDDIIVFADSREEVLRRAERIRNFLAEAGLTVNPDKEQLFAPEEGWNFLGFSYREGTVVFKEVSAKSSPEEVGLLTDSYALNSKGDALTLYSGDFKGDSVTFSLRGDNGLTAVNGQGGRTNYKLRSSVNLAQMRAQPARKPGEDPKLPRGTTVMPFDPRR